jgi:adenylate cyclase
MTRGKPSFGSRLRIAAAILVTLTVAIGYVTARPLPMVEAIEGQALNWRFRLRGPLTPGPETVLVTIDDKTLAALDQRYPSRSHLARAVAALSADGARVIAFDLLLIGREGAAVGPEPSDADRALRDAIRGAGNVIVPFAFVFDPQDADLTTLTPEIEAAAFRVTQAPPGRRPALAPRPAGLLVPAPEFLAAGSGAHVNVVLSADGGLRFAHPVIGYGGRYFPSLPIEAARLYLGVARDRVALRFDQGIGLGDRLLPTDEAMRVAVNYYGPARTFVNHSLIDLIEGRLPSGSFADRVVLIGATAQGWGDRFATPYSPALPGVEVFATVIDNLLHGRWLVRSPWIRGLDLLAIVLCGLAGAMLARLGTPLAMVMMAAVLLGAWSGLNFLLFSQAGLWLDFTFPTAALLLSVAVAVAGRLMGEYGLRRRAERQRQSLSRYVSTALTDSLVDDGRSLAPEHTHYAAILFVDMAGFTGLSETMAPRETLALLRAFHRAVEARVLAHGGVIDKFIGDAVLAVFGLQGARPEDPVDALACARDLAGGAGPGPEDGRSATALAKLGIGLHFGPVAVGEVGGETQAQLTVTGDTVNVASRLQDLTRAQDTAILASDALMEAVRAQGGSALLEGFEELPMQEIRGRRRPIGIWAWRPETSQD